MREILLGAMLGCYGLGLALMVIFAMDLKRLLAEVPEIRAASDMERYKRSVGKQMVGALVQIIVLLAPWAFFGYGVVKKVITARDLLLFVVLPSILIFVAGQIMKGLERRVKTLPAPQEFLAERDRVVQTWIKKPLPDW
jgi:hypothetical protein